MRTENGITWNLIPNSFGQLSGIAGTGKNIFASQQFGGNYFTATEADPFTWTQLTTPNPYVGWGSYWMAYDPDHDILYSSNQTGGLWRMITE